MPFWTRKRDEPIGEDVSLVVGLGNPGRQYEDTRHNVGFMAVEAFAEKHGMQFKGSKQRADVARGTVDGRAVLLAEPLTYMNESGLAVSALGRYYRIDSSRLLVVCDDIDLPFGTLRMRAQGSSGGQRGLQSIIQQLGTDRFPRLRIGVSRPRGEAVGHVLGRFSAGEEALLPGLLDVAVSAVEAFLTEEVVDVMNRFNRDWLPELTAAK